MRKLSVVLLLTILSFMSSAGHALTFKSELPDNVWIHRKAKVVPSTKKQRKRALTAIKRKTHPVVFSSIVQQVNTIYIVTELKHRETGGNICGTYFDNDIIVSIHPHCGIENIDYYVTHEYSSLVLNKWFHRFPSREWGLNNGFPYNDRDMWPIITGQKHEKLRFLNENGFFELYCTVSREEDFNVLIGYYYEDKSALNHVTARYPKVRNKVRLAVKFFEKYAGK